MNPEIEQLFSYKGISSGYALLDKEIGGWQNGDLIIIGSRPALGKTAFAINIALNAAAGMNIPVLFFTLEMSSESLVKRMIIREAEINIKDIDGKHIIEKEDWPKVEKRLLEIHKCPLYIDDTPGLLVDDFAEKVGKAVKDKGVKMVIVDYLQLMRGHEKYLGMREDEVSFIVRSLKMVALAYNVPIIALSQLSRLLHSTGSEHTPPQLKDIRDSRSIEEAADLILLIDRPTDEEIEECPAKANNAEIIIAKNHDGYKGSVLMRFKSETLRFADAYKLSHITTRRTAHSKSINRSSRLNTSLTFDSFRVTDNNSVAVQMAKEVVKSPGKRSSNPFILMGNFGSGKTHLVNAIGNAISKEHPRMTVFYVTGDEFKRQYMDAVKLNRLTEFKDRYDKVDVLILDNLQELVGPGTQNCFFHVMDQMYQKDKQIVLTCSQGLEEMKGMLEERLIEHCRWGTTIETGKAQ